MADMYERKPQNLTGPEGSPELKVKYIDNGDGTWSLSVGAVTLPLPAGAATSAKQDTQAIKLDTLIAALNTPDSALDGSKTVETAGEAEPLAASSTPCVYVLIQAKPGNTANCFVGNSSSQSTELEPGQPWAFAIDNLTKIYVKPGADNEGVNFSGGAISP